MEVSTEAEILQYFPSPPTPLPEAEEWGGEETKFLVECRRWSKPDRSQRLVRFAVNHCTPLRLPRQRN